MLFLFLDFYFMKIFSHFIKNQIIQKEKHICILLAIMYFIRNVLNNGWSIKKNVQIVVPLWKNIYRQVIIIVVSFNELNYKLPDKYNI